MWNTRCTTQFINCANLKYYLAIYNCNVPNSVAIYEVDHLLLDTEWSIDNWFMLDAQLANAMMIQLRNHTCLFPPPGGFLLGHQTWQDIVNCYYGIVVKIISAVGARQSSSWFWQWVDSMFWYVKSYNGRIIELIPGLLAIWSTGLIF